MNTMLHFQPKRGFTLLELLIVIAIIALLATLSIPASNTVFRRMKEMKATKTASELRAAIVSYQGTYKYYPKFGGSGIEDRTFDTSDSAFVAMMLAIPDDAATTEHNRRSIPFFSGKRTKTGRDGLTDDNQLKDPWGNTYSITVDGDMNNAIDVEIVKGDGAQQVMSPVAVWTTNPDTNKILIAY